MPPAAPRSGRETTRLERATRIIRQVQLVETLDTLRHLVGDRRQELQQGEAAERRLVAAEQARPRRGRGRPRRTDIERATLVRALAQNGGSRRAAARALNVPHNTLLRHAEGIREWAWRYGPEVFVELHARLLYGSDVSPDVARLRGYRSILGEAVHGSRRNRILPGLLVPLWTVHGTRAWSQVRLDAPPSPRLRYHDGPGAVPIVDCSPAARPRVLDSERTLYVTESPRKADAAVSRQLACVSFPGVRKLCFDSETWDYIGVRGRDVRICFDGDAATNREVAAAEWWLTEFLRSKGAKVTVHRLFAPKTGLDDYLSAGHRIEDLPIAEVPAEPPRKLSADQNAQTQWEQQLREIDLEFRKTSQG